MDDAELVMVVPRAATGLLICKNGCGYPVAMDARAAEALKLGGWLMCKECADILAQRHPEDWSPATEFDGLLPE